MTRRKTKRRQGGKGVPLTPERARELARLRLGKGDVGAGLVRTAPPPEKYAQAGAQAPTAPPGPLGAPEVVEIDESLMPGGAGVSTASESTAISAPRLDVEARRRVRDGILLEGGQRLGDVMDDWQREDFEALDDPQYKHAYLERPRGHSKTGDVGTEACVELLAGAPDQKLYCYAADQDQASILFADARDKLIRGGHVQDGKGKLRRGKVRVLRDSIVSWTGSVLKVQTADVSTSWGLRPDWLACDELVEWRHPELWQSLWTATGKRPNSRVLVISTAGWDQSHFAWDVRKIAESEADWYFSAREQCASWISPAWLAQQERTLPAHVYARLHENKWVDGVGAFLTAAEVDAVFSGDVPDAPGRDVIGLDVGLTKDRTVLAHVRATADGLFVVRGLETWTGRKGEKVDLPEVEEAAYQAAKHLHAPVWADPFQAVQLAQRLRARGVRVVEHAITSASRPRLFASLLLAVRERRLKSPPHDALRRELLGLEVKEGLAGFRVDHKPGRNDDHVFSVALALAGLLERGEGFTLSWSATETTGERAAAFWRQRQDPNTMYTPAQAPGQPPPPAKTTTCCAHGVDVMDAAHRVECREARLKWKALPESAAPTLVSADSGTHYVTGPGGKGEVYRDPRGLGPAEPSEQCGTCGTRYPVSAQAQHRLASPRCRPKDPGALVVPGWRLTAVEGDRVQFLHDACGFNGNTRRTNLRALVARHARERHPD